MRYFKRTHSMRTLFAALLGCLVSAQATRLASVQVLDQDYLMVRFLDGEVAHKDDGKGIGAFTSIIHDPTADTVKTYGTALSTSNAVAAASWSVQSATDANYSTAKSPTACSRKSKLNGLAEGAWVSSDYNYQYTMEHTLYLKLPSSLVQGKTYTLAINSNTNSDVVSVPFTFDIYNSRTEALHVNLVGYSPDVSSKAADLYQWMGDGGARDYSTFVGKKVYLYDVATSNPQQVGAVSFWKASGSDAGGFNLTQSAVWNVDFSSVTDTGTFRLAVEGVGASQDFKISSTVYRDPFDVSLKGFFYMRVGQDSTGGTRPVPRRPLYIPGVDPANTTIFITTAQPYDANSWNVLTSGGDPWDKTTPWAAYNKPGNPTNTRARGGHADAADWDRHLGHISDLYDLLLPIILTDGAPSDDDAGIAESGNGIPDLIDEARNEVDFWLQLRDGQGYSHGVNNPTAANVFYQAGTNAVAAWANAANASMLAEAFRISGKTALSDEYRDSAVAAYDYANGLADPQLDKTQNIGESVIRGRDLKMTAAAFLYSLTGTVTYEQVVDAESVCASSTTADLDDGKTLNQIYATAAYLKSSRIRNYPTLVSNMKACVVNLATQKNLNPSNARPSRKSAENNASYYQTIEFVHPLLLAHAISDAAADKAKFRKALVLEADWSLGRNPLNMIQMTTASTVLASKRSVERLYASGGNDGTPGFHPGLTPYLNPDDWSCGMVMGCPSWLTGKSYPATTWPRAEIYFNTQYLYAHSEFTPQQTMRGKMALYGYLHALGQNEAGTTPPTATEPRLRHAAAISPVHLRIAGTRVELPKAGVYKVRVLDVSGRVLWAKTIAVEATTESGWRSESPGLRLVDIHGDGISLSRKLMN